MAGATLTSYTTRGGIRWRLTGRTTTDQFSRSFTDEAKARGWQRIFHEIGADKALAALDAGEKLPDGQGETPSQRVRWIVDESIRLRTGITDGTRDSYRQMAEDWIHPFLGDRLIKSLDRDDIREWVNNLQAKGLSHNSIRHRHNLLSTSFKWAIEKKLMTANPAFGVRLPEGEGRDMCILETEEVTQLIEAIDPFYRDLIIILIGTGMRWGEATALLTNDITVRPHQVSIRVNKGWQRASKGPMKVGPGKTKMSRRTINLPVGTPAYDALIRQLARHGRGEITYLFTSKMGYILRASNFTATEWGYVRDRLVREYGWLKYPRIHDLRHTAASLMLGNGASLSAVQTILGHNKPSTTLDLYGHLLKDGEQNALAALGRAMNVA